MLIYLHILLQSVWENKSQVLTVPCRLCLVNDSMVRRGKDDVVGGVVVQTLCEG